MINDQILIREPSSVFLGESHLNSTWIHLLQGKSRQLLYSTEFLSPGFLHHPTLWEVHRPGILGLGKLWVISNGGDLS